MYHQPVVLKDLQDLPHVYNVLLVIPAADDDIIYPGKGGLAVSNIPVHVPLERRPRIPQTERHPLVLEQAQGGCAADFSLLNLPKGKSLGRSKPATSSYAQAPQHTVWEILLYPSLTELPSLEIK